MEATVIRAGNEHRAELWRLGREAFGGTEDSMPEDFPDPTSDTRTTFAITEGGRVVAKAVDRHFGSWWWHRILPTAGVAGVAVDAERRGEGIATPLMRELLHNARERGAVISALYPATSAIYRRFGYQTVTNKDLITLPTRLLSHLDRSEGGLERVDPAHPDIAKVYRSWASRQNAPLDRTGKGYWIPSDPPGGTTVVAHDADGAPVGVARWSRQPGDDGQDAVQQVDDLYAISADGFRLLAGALADSADTEPATRVARASHLFVRSLLGGVRWEVTQTAPYMVAILDIVAVLTGRAWAHGIDVLLEFGVAGLPIDGSSGTYRLEVANGEAECERIGEVDDALPCFTAGGFAQRYAGALSNANLRFTGGLSGPTDDDIVWDALFGGWQCQVLDSY